MMIKLLAILKRVLGTKFHQVFGKLINFGHFYTLLYSFFYLLENFRPIGRLFLEHGRGLRALE